MEGGSCKGAGEECGGVVGSVLSGRFSTNGSFESVVPFCSGEPSTRVAQFEKEKAFLICCARALLLFEVGRIGLSHVGHV